MRDDRKRWRRAEGWGRKLDDLPGLRATIIRPKRQTLISGPTSAALKASNLADAAGWPGPAKGDHYAIRLRRDRLLVVDGEDRAHPSLDEGWHDELGIAVSDITGGLALIELSEPSVPTLLATGAEIDPATPSPAASWLWHGMACIVYKYETDKLFRLHVSLSQLEAACDMVAWQASSITRLDR